MRSPRCIGIAGGSGSGKTTVARALADHFGEQASMLSLDAYYRDQSDLLPERRTRLNFDHPEALDWGLFRTHLERLRRGLDVVQPAYDFATHTRVTSAGTPIRARPVILAEGVLLFCRSDVWKLFDLHVFVDLPPDLRFIRRLMRDRRERGRDTDSVVRQYLTTVRPMYFEWVEPALADVDLVIRGDSQISDSVQQVLQHFD